MTRQLALPPGDIRRILERQASLLIRQRELKRGVVDVQDGLTVARNRERLILGRRDMQLDPSVCTIEITSVEPATLFYLGYKQIRQAGFVTQRDFYDEWLARFGVIEPFRDVFVVSFKPVEQARFLHRRVYRGYTSDPLQAAKGEPEALSREDLERYADTARWRDEQIRRERVNAQRDPPPWRRVA